MGIHFFPSEFVFWETLEEHSEIKKKLLPIILKNSDKAKNNPFDNCTFNTSFYKGDDEKFKKENKFLTERKHLDSIVFKNIDKMLRTLGFNEDPGIDFLLQNCWWNVYNEGEYQEEHNHVAAPAVVDDKLFYPSLSVVYILHDENEKGSLVFKRRGTVPLRPPYNTTSMFKTGNVEEIKEGSVLIFPASLDHLIKPSIKPGRVTIAYNICASYQ